MQDESDNAIHLITRAEWRAWLEQHHMCTEGVRLISFKKSGITFEPMLTFATSADS